jgi:hypothetical protein
MYGCSAWPLGQTSGTAISSSATSAGVLYTSATDNNDAVTILGYVDYGSGLVTAGNYATAPTVLQRWVAGMPKPGDIYKRGFVSGSSAQSIAVIPLSAVDIVKLSGTINLGTSGVQATVAFKRGSTSLFSVPLSSTAVGSDANGQSVTLFDAPATTNSTTYSITNSTGTINEETLLLELIMG